MTEAGRESDRDRVGNPERKGADQGPGNDAGLSSAPLLLQLLDQLMGLSSGATFLRISAVATKSTVSWSLTSLRTTP